MKKLMIPICVALFWACSSQQQLTTAKININGTEMLYGRISRDQLFYDFPEWENGYESYIPDSNVVKELSQTAFPGQILLFLGTWCHDSMREVPRFFRILDQAGLYDPEKISIWAVDRTKKLADNTTDTYDVYFVPTIIFMNDSREIGRIVEHPENRLEDDMLRIVSGKND
jgi:hypothetical protein